MPGTVTAREIEERTQRIGREFFDRIRGSQPWIFRREWWQERLLQQCMADEWFKVQSFRFVDALPMLGEDRELARHLREYFVLPADRNGHAGAGDHGAGADPAELERPAQRWFVRAVSRALNFQRLDSPWALLAARAARRSALLMAGNFIAGSNVAEAQRAIRRLRDWQLAFTIDVLGEAALSRREAEAYHATYLDLIRELPRHAATWPAVPLIDQADGQLLPRVNVSVKLTSLHPGFEPLAAEAAKARAKELLRPLLREAQAGGVFIHIDMEHYAVKDLTLDLCEELFAEPEFRDYPHLGIVLQTYLKDADADVARTIAYAQRRGTPFWVRLVKGAYWDSETVWADQAHWPWPVWEQKWQSDACYERSSRRLLENHRYVRTAFASHNVRSLAHAIALRELYDVPGTAFELQMLYGMGEPIKRAAAELGQRCRIYTPYGPLLAGMAYFIRRLLENTANESFLRHAADTPVAELLRDPSAAGLPPARTADRFGLAGGRKLTEFEGGAEGDDGAEASPALVERAAEPVCPARYDCEEASMEPFENVPNMDFARPAAREQMTAALAQVRAGLGGEVPLRIGGQALATGRWRDALNPSHPQEKVARVAQADEAMVHRAVRAAGEALAGWRQARPAQRAAVLFRAAERMQQERFVLAAREVLACARPWREADADVSEAIDYCRYYGREMGRLAAQVRTRDIPGETNEYFYAPRGIVAVISPWSFPLSVPAGMIAAALVTGNTVVFKPASPAAVVGSALVEIFEQAGLPPGALNFLPGPGEVVGAALVRHAGVRTIAFTGSRAVGTRINQLAAESAAEPPGLKKVIPQLGAKNAIIIDSDADLDESIKAVVASAFGYAGQKCTAASRVIVVGQAYDRFLERLVENLRTAALGPAEEPTTFIPPLIDASAAEQVQRYITLGQQEVRCVLAVEPAPPLRASGAAYVGPVIFADVPPQARIAQEEIFGPVLCVLRAADIDEAIRLFNASDYALTGAIFSRSPGNIERARHECECGNFYINRRTTGSHVDLQPFGGLKLSGYGALAGGPDYLVQFCEPRTVTENTIRRGFAPSEKVLRGTGAPQPA